MESIKEDPESDNDVVTKLSSKLECPICFNVPRDLPIPACPAGHIICKFCRPSVTECPTCRRRLYDDGTSSLAASMIEFVPHKCKFSEYGCEEKDYLHELKNHEEKCAERTVKCPASKCGAQVQLKKFEEHAEENECWKTLHYTTYNHTISSGFMKWDGISKNRGPEFDLDRKGKCSWIHSGDFFVTRKYYPDSKVTVFAVLMAKDPEKVKKYSANITIYRGSLETNYKCPIIPIEQFPPEEELIDHEGSWSVHYSLLRKFFYFEDKGENNNHDWLVKYKWKVEIDYDDDDEDDYSEE